MCWNDWKSVSKALSVVALALFILESVTHMKFLTWAAIIAVLLAAVCNQIAEHSRWKANQLNPVVAEAAKLQDKRTEQQRHGRYRVEVKYYLSFRILADNSRLELEVCADEFDAHEIGEVGLLQHRGWEYIIFLRE